MKKFSSLKEVIYGNFVENLKTCMILLLALLLIIQGVSNTSKTNAVTPTKEVDTNNYDTSSEEYIAVKTALDNFIDMADNTDTAYLIANSIQLPSDTSYYVEVVDKNDNFYTELPVDNEGNYGTVAFDKSANLQYVLSDYYVKETDSLYTLNNVSGDISNPEYSWAKMPSVFATDMLSRKYLYADKIIDKLYDITRTDDQSIDSSGKTLKMYTAKISSEYIKDIVSADNWVLFNDIKKEFASDANISSLMDVYLETLKTTLVFSNGVVYFGIDDKDRLAFLQIGAGGLGEMMYDTKVVYYADDEKYNIREVPDFSEATDYIANVKDLADYVAMYDSYSEALEHLYADDNKTQTDTTQENTGLTYDSSKNVSIDVNGNVFDAEGNKIEGVYYNESEGYILTSNYDYEKDILGIASIPDASSTESSEDAGE